MAWITPTVADVQKALNAPEFAAYTAADQALDAASFLSAQVDLARGYCPVKDADPATVPPELKGAVLKLTIVELLRGIPAALSGLDETLGRWHDEAMAQLRDASRGILAISPPASTTAAPSPSPSPSFTPCTRQWTRDSQEGV